MYTHTHDAPPEMRRAGDCPQFNYYFYVHLKERESWADPYLWTTPPRRCVEQEAAHVPRRRFTAASARV